MSKRQKIEEALAKLGITTEAELNAAIKALKPVNVSLMIGDLAERKAS